MGTHLLHGGSGKETEASPLQELSWTLPGSWSQDFRNFSLACHMLLPQTLGFHSKQPLPGRPGACGGWATAQRARWRLCEHQGAGPKTVKGKNALARDPLYFLPRPGVGSSSDGWSCSGFRRERAGDTELTRARLTSPTDPQPLPVAPARPVRTGRQNSPHPARLETLTQPSLSIPLLDPDLLAGHLACARQRAGRLRRRLGGRDM